MNCIGDCINCEQKEDLKIACCNIQTLKQTLLLRKEIKQLQEQISSLKNELKQTIDLNDIQTPNEVAGDSATQEIKNDMILINPVSLSTTEQVLAYNIIECLRPPINTNSINIGSVTFVAGTPVLQNGFAFIPITATLSLTYTTGCNNNAHDKLYSETFNVAFQATTVPTVTLEQVSGPASLMTGTDLSCGCICNNNLAKQYSSSGVLTITVS
jgi:hypothetical protein